MSLCCLSVVCVCRLSIIQDISKNVIIDLPVCGSNLCCGCALELFEGCSFNECVGPTLDPLSGPLESGNPVTIRGGNLDEILSVFFHSTEVSIGARSDTSMIVFAPSGTEENTVKVVAAFDDKKRGAIVLGEYTFASGPDMFIFSTE